MEKYQARTFFFNHAASILETIATKLREGDSCGGYSAAEAERFVEQAATLALLSDVTENQASEMAEAISYAGPLPKGVREAFSALTGFEFECGLAPELVKAQ